MQKPDIENTIRITKLWLHPLGNAIGQTGAVVCRQLADEDCGLPLTKAQKVVDDVRMKVKKGLQSLHQIPEAVVDEDVAEPTNACLKDPRLKHLFK